MSGLTRADIALLVTLVPLWLVCSVLHVDRQTSDRPIAWFPLYVASAAGDDAYPTALMPWPDVEPGVDDVRAGDVLLAMDGRDLRGASRLFVMTHAYEASREGRVPFAVQRDGQTIAADVALAIVPYAWSHLLVSLSMGLFATLVLIRGRGSRAARAYALAALVFSLHFCSLYGGSPGMNRFAFVLILTTGAFYPPLMLRAALLFPPKLAPRSERVLLYPWILLVTGPALYIWLFGVPALGLFGFRYASACFSLAIAALLVILVRNYRRAEARERRQMHWGIYGFFIATVPPLVASALSAGDPSLRWIYESALGFQVVLPLFLGIALLRDNLFDINRLITLTMAGILLAPLVLGFGMQFEPMATTWLSNSTDLQTSTARSALVVGFVLMIVVPGRLLQSRIEQWLFRDEYRLERSLRALRASLAEIRGAGAMLDHLGSEFTALGIFETFAVYARLGEAFVPLSAAGPLVPPAFAATGLLPVVLVSSEGPLLARSWRRLARSGALSAQEIAQLDGLGAEILLPLRRDDELAAFVVLGAKRSGDVYSRTEIAMLEGLADRVGLELSTIERDALLAEEQVLYEKLAHYAPGSVVEELTRGGDVTPGTSEVTVVFIDIRGYSILARDRATPEVFELINNYTMLVSRRIRERGGSVVEFHGDGLMAAFGAPSPLDEKERRAVDAARAIIKDMRSGALGLADAGPIQVGIGIATGTAFVGNIQSVDRKIWAVIGQTTNLAARLEGLTRSLDTDIVIDSVTRSRIEEASEGFVRQDGVRVKGWDEPITIWRLQSPVLPVPGEAH